MATSDGFGVGFTGWTTLGCCPVLSSNCLGASSGSPSAAANAFAFGFADPGGPLPVTLLDFTAQQEENHVKVEWTTASETNNDYFSVEKSQDGLSWAVADVVPGAGNSTTAIHYESIDEHPISGLSYYRLRQTDYDGTSEYFSTVSVMFTANNIALSPNPADSYIEVTGNGIADIELFNTLGEKVTVPGAFRRGEAVLDVSALKRGLYYMVVLDAAGDIIKREKIILSR
jgi:hypothetical protein